MIRRFYSFVQMNATKESAKIIVIGAGAAGIAAASRLFQYGFKNITILEAEGRIGGRIYTKQFGGYWVDLGGQWVHGEEDNSVYELAWPHGVLEKSIGNWRRRLLSSSGSAVPEDVGQNFFRFFSNLTGSGIPKEHLNGSIGEHYKPKIDEYFEGHPEIATNQRKPFEEMLNLFQMAADAGDNWSSVSARGIYEYEDCRGDHMIHWKDKGFSVIFDILMKKFPNPIQELPIMKNVVLNTEVSKISYNNSDGAVNIVSTKGYKYQADHVIVTTSLGVLKTDHESLFDPPLSKARINAIKNVEFGSVAKIFLYFPEPWWLDVMGNSVFGSALSFYWTEEDRKEISKDPERSWMLGIFNLILVECKPRLMCAWLAGPYAKDMEKIAEKRVFQQMKEFLYRFLGKTYNITEPTEMLRTQWFTDPHFRGTYTYRSLETERSGVTMKELAEPIINNGKLVVLFAGEATSWDRYASVHGAISSGWREADKLIQLYSDGKQKAGTR